MGRHHNQKTNNPKSQNLPSLNVHRDRMAFSYLTHHPNSQRHSYLSMQSHISEQQHWANIDTGETPRPSGSLSQTLRSTSLSCQTITLIRNSYATMHDNADGGSGRGRVAPVHQLSLSILSSLFVYTLSYGLAKRKLREWVILVAFVVRASARVKKEHCRRLLCKIDHCIADESLFSYWASVAF